MINNIMIFIPEIKVFLRAKEGDGTNLWDKDIENGNVDYVIIDTYELDDEDLVGLDGGMMMLTESFTEKYKEDKCGRSLIKDAMKFMFNDRYDYYVIEKKERVE